MYHHKQRSIITCTYMYTVNVLCAIEPRTTEERLFIGSKCQICVQTLFPIIKGFHRIILHVWVVTAWHCIHCMTLWYCMTLHDTQWLTVLCQTWGAPLSVWSAHLDSDPGLPARYTSRLHNYYGKVIKIYRFIWDQKKGGSKTGVTPTSDILRHT